MDSHVGLVHMVYKSGNHPGSSVLVSAAFARSKYFYIVTLALKSSLHL